MAPVIHLVRHAQGVHNVRTENQWFKDPDLTDLGKEQCADLCSKFPYHDKITHLVASPMRRTLYTCKLSFEPALKGGKKKIIALQDAQEVSLYPCDVGTDLSELKKEFGEDVDFSLVSEDWNVKTPESDYYPDPKKLEARTRRARLWLRDQLLKDAGEDAHLVLVTHGGILHFITEDWVGIEPGRGTAWENTEYRSYEFADKTGQDPNASIVELPESRRRRYRGAQPQPPTDAEMRALRHTFETGLNNDVSRCLQMIAQKTETKSAA
ncbi:phosphoglycerate mutase-like protein [Xylariaceae sp. FL0594]|nr:phosphoglycerate mutase-like protein [Xylariaceae sp. FL0594]